MRRAIVPVILAWVLELGSAAGATAGVLVGSARLESGSAGDASLVLELSGTTASRLFRLEAPDRVVLDLPATQLAPGLRLPAGAGPVAIVRSGVQPGATLRLVLETRGTLTARTRI